MNIISRANERLNAAFEDPAHNLHCAYIAASVGLAAIGGVIAKVGVESADKGMMLMGLASEGIAIRAAYAAVQSARANPPESQQPQA